MTATRPPGRQPDRLPGRWGAVPASWFTHPDLGLDEIGVLACLATYADAEGWCWPKQATIATHLKRSRPWVIKVINRLVELGVIERVQQYGRDGGQRPCRYRIRYDAAPGHASSHAPGHRTDTGSHAADSPCHPGDSEHRESEHKESLSPGGGEVVAREGRTVVPPDWQPSAEDVAWAAARFPDIDLPRFTEQFINSCHANGYRYLDHGRAWRSWLADSPKRNLTRSPTRRSPHARASAAPAAVSAVPTLSTVSGGGAGAARRPSVPVAERADLTERNREAAGAARRRLLERRAGGLFADGPAA